MPELPAGGQGRTGADVAEDQQGPGASVPEPSPEGLVEPSCPPAGHALSRSLASLAQAVLQRQGEVELRMDAGPIGGDFRIVPAVEGPLQAAESSGRESFSEASRQALPAVVEPGDELVEHPGSGQADHGLIGRRPRVGAGDEDRDRVGRRAVVEEGARMEGRCGCEGHAIVLDPGCASIHRGTS